MEVGIREAKNNLSRLVGAALDGEEVFLTNRGERVAQLIPAARTGQKGRGRGFWKEKIHFYPGWDSVAEDQKIEWMFEGLREGSK
jgi:prevent-host-death family protein